MEGNPCEGHALPALHSPSTGIIDSHALMLALLGDAERAGALLALKCRLASGARRSDGFELHVAGAEPILAAQVVNSAGLRAPSVACRIDGYPAELAPPELYAKGNYYTLSRRSPFSRLATSARARGFGRARDARLAGARASAPT
jgi:L-2-hydroxyglutarate oxidase LhgO